MDNDKWSYTELWTKRGDEFAVEVKRQSIDGVTPSIAPVNLWNVYAHIYPNHPYFKNFDSSLNEYCNAVDALPFHRGATYYKFTDNCVTIGSDYNHYGDDYHQYISRREDATEQFDDAEKLFQFMSDHNNPAFKMDAGEMEGDDNEDPEGLANAHLIAAAPDLLEVAESFAQVTVVDGHAIGLMSEFFTRARAAIAKAKGENHE